MAWEGSPQSLKKFPNGLLFRNFVPILNGNGQFMN
jgi:hypothetical protein